MTLRNIFDGAIFDSAIFDTDDAGHFLRNRRRRRYREQRDYVDKWGVWR